MQSVLPTEIIISDNASDGNDAELVFREFETAFTNIRYFRQEKNVGAINNFVWLLENANSDRFMWLADDDELHDVQLIQKLNSRMESDKDLSLVFPEVDVFFGDDRKEIVTGLHHGVFGECSNDWEYLKAFSRYGGGHCFYGMYNRSKLLSIDPSSLFDRTISYFNEGKFLHKIFLDGGVRFEPTARLLYDGTSASKQSPQDLLHAFKIYSESVVQLYKDSELSFLRKRSILRRINRSHTPYINHLINTQK